MPARRYGRAPAFIELYCWSAFLTSFLLQREKTMVTSLLLLAVLNILFQYASAGQATRLASTAFSRASRRNAD
jgi:hypothetical protein